MADEYSGVDEGNPGVNATCSTIGLCVHSPPAREGTNVCFCLNTLGAAVVTKRRALYAKTVTIKKTMTIKTDKGWI